VQHITDDVARILASPIPRREAFTRLTAVLFGGVLASFGIRAGDVQQSSCRPPSPSPAHVCCGTTWYDPSVQACCGTTCFDPKTSQCCGSSNSLCPSNKKCCGTVQQGNKFCLTAPKQCSNSPGR
jgi:hypothetical protein